MLDYFIIIIIKVFKGLEDWEEKLTSGIKLESFSAIRDSVRMQLMVKVPL